MGNASPVPLGYTVTNKGSGNIELSQCSNDHKSNTQFRHELKPLTEPESMIEWVEPFCWSDFKIKQKNGGQEIVQAQGVSRTLSQSVTPKPPLWHLTLT